MSVKSFKTSGIKVDLAPQGLVLLNTTSFSAVASQSINDVFSATYDNYNILIKSVGVTNNSETYIRYRVSGADNTTNSYQNFLPRWTSGGFTTFDLSLSNQSIIGRSDDTITTTNFDIFSPFLTERTTAFGQNFCDTQVTWGGMQFTGTTSFTGFTIYPGSSTFTGTVSVYGYNK